MEFSDGGVHRGGQRGNHQRGRVRTRVKQFSLGDVMVSFSHGHSEKDTMKGGVDESGGRTSYESMETVKVKKRQGTFGDAGKCESQRNAIFSR